MNREQLYKETVDIILDAYNEKKLVHGHPCGCFIGNLVAKKYTVRPATFKNSAVYTNFWYSPDWFYHLISKEDCTFSISTSMEEAMKQAEAIGYTVDEIRLLEHAFEDVEEELTDGGGHKQIKGMRAALEMLATIHETEPEQSLERLKTIQTKVYA